LDFPTWVIIRLERVRHCHRAVNMNYRGHNFSTFIMKSLFFLAGNFSIVPFGPLSMRIWRPFEENRTCAPFLVPATPG